MNPNLRSVTKEKRELQMMRRLMPATVVAMTTKIAFTLLCCTVLVLVATPARADGDVCSAATSRTCGVTITITGTSGHLTATIVGGGEGSAYDGSEDELVGIINNSSAAVGAIVLSGPDAFGFETGDANDGACVFFGLGTVARPCGPTGYEGVNNLGLNNTFVGISTDLSTGKVLFTTPLAAGASTWFSLESTPTSVVAIGEAKTLTASATAFPFGPVTGSGPFTENATVDDYQITPLSALTPGADMMTITAIPVLSNQFGAANFPTLNCIPYADYSSLGNPVCVEVERDCTGPDCANLVYSATLDFNIDANSQPTGVGGAAFLGQAGTACPTKGFDRNITSSYTGSAIGTGVDPLKGGSGGGGSCYVGAFDPTAADVAPGVAVSTFFGFEFPVSDTKVNPILQPIPVLLNWDLKDTSGNPVTNLILCANTSCPTGGANPPWVNLSLIALTPNVANCTAIANASSPLPSVPNLLVKGHPPLGLVNFGKGEYSFVWNTATNLKLKGCQVRVVAQFSSGAFDAPAVFQYAY